jgi:hypothetical protein
LGGSDDRAAGEPLIAARQDRGHRARVDIGHVKRQAARRGVELVQEAAADDQDLTGRMLGGDVAQERAEVALERPVVQRPRELPRPRVVGEVIGGVGHRGGSSAASAMIRYS